MHERLAGAASFVLLCGWLGVARADDDLVLDLAGASEPEGDGGPAGRRLELRRVPAGKLVQGSPPKEVGREADETLRDVTITRSFWLGRTPVTRAQFARFVSETRHVTAAEKNQAGGHGWDPKSNAIVHKKEHNWRNPGFSQTDDDPVVLVTFGDANAFASWASRKTGRRVRLPTEAEWELAARAGTSTPWYGGATAEDALATGWFRTNASGSTHPVGLKKPNALGLFDMAGNVQEWCRDVYAPYAPGDVVDPESTPSASNDTERRVLRGGSWLRDTKRGRSAARSKLPPGTRHADIGFRIAVDDEVAQQPGLGSTPGTDFAPAAPVGLGSSAAATPAPDAKGPAAAPPARASSDGAPWTMIVAPLASAAAAVGWVLARRRARARADADRPPLAGVREGLVVTPNAVPIAGPVRPREDALIEEILSPPSAPQVPESSPRAAAPPPVGPPTPAILPGADAAPGHAGLEPPPKPLSLPRHAIVDQRESESPFLASPAAPAPAEGGGADAKSAKGRAAELMAFDAWMASAKAEAAKASEARLAAARAITPRLGAPPNDAPSSPSAPMERTSAPRVEGGSPGDPNKDE